MTDAIMIISNDFLLWFCEMAATTTTTTTKKTQDVEMTSSSYAIRHIKTNDESDYS